MVTDLECLDAVLPDVMPEKIRHGYSARSAGRDVIGMVVYLSSSQQRHVSSTHENLEYGEEVEQGELSHGDILASRR